MQDHQDAKPTQQQFDFPRKDQLGLLKEIELGGCKGVSPRMAKHTLQAIDSFGRQCWASVNTIAGAMGASRRSVQRAIDYLESISLIVVGDGERGHRKRVNACGTVTNTIRIVWSELEVLAHKQKLALRSRSTSRSEAVSRSEHGATVTPYHGATVSEHGATVSEHGATVSEHGAMVSEHGATVTPKPEEYKEPQPSLTHAIAREAAAHSFVDPWEAVVRRLNQIGIDRTNEAIRSAKEKSIDPTALFEIINEYERHRTRFRSPGAIIERLRTGHWPVSLTAKPAPLGSNEAELARTRAIINEITNVPEEQRAKPFTEEQRREFLSFGRPR